MPLPPRACSANRPSSLALLAGVIVALFLCFSPAAFGAVTTYTGVWAGGTIAPNDAVVLNNGARITGNVITNGTLQFNQSGTTLTVSSTISGTGTLSLTNTGTLALGGTTALGVIALDMTTRVSAGQLSVADNASMASAIRIGNSGTGTLIVTGGKVTADSGFDLGYAAGSRGTATITGGLLGVEPFDVARRDFRIGVDGEGALNINGGVARGSTAYLGYGKAYLGTVTVSSGTLDLSGNLNIGYANNLYGTATGTSTLTVNGGSVVSQNGYIASGFSSRGLATVSSGTWSTQSIILGDGGAGELMVNGGAVIGSSSAYLGRSGGGTGLVTVASGRWDHNSLYVESGTLAINGGNVNTSGGVILEGGLRNARTATISGGTWTIGGGVSINGTNSTFTVNGGRVTSVGSAFIGANDSGGAAIVSSGTWDMGAATMTLWGDRRAGTISVTGGSLVSGDVYLRGGDATASGGTWAIGTYCFVGGDPRTGTLTVAGGNVSSQQLRVGDGYGNGVVTVSSGTVTQQILYVGFSGTQGSGMLSVSGGAVTTGSLAFVRNRGVATVSGGTWAANQLTIGESAGAGSVVISGSGRVSIGGGSGLIPLYSGTLSFANGLTTGTLQASAIDGGTGAALVLFEQPGTYTMQPVLSGSLAVTQSGLGVTVLTGVNTYTGATTISSGTLQVGNGGTTGSLGSGPVVNNGSLTFNRSDNYGGAIGSNETQSITGAGSVRLVAGSLTLSGSNTYTGTTTISGGTLQIGSGSTTGWITSNVVNNAAMAFNRSDAVAYTGTISGSGSLTKRGTGTLMLLGSNSFTGDTRIESGTLAIGSGGATGSIAGNVVNNAALAFNRSDAVLYTSTVSGGGALVKLGAGLLTLTGSNTYTGGTVLADGVLELGSGDALGSTGMISFTGGTLRYSAANTTDYSHRFGASQSIRIDTNGQLVIFGSVLSGTSGLVKTGSGTLLLRGSNSFTGGTTISGGTLQIGAGGTTGLVAGNVVNNGGLAFNRSDAVTYSGTISGSGAVTKLGAGTLTLSGSNSYSGGTVVSAGTLAILHASALGGTTSALAMNAGVFDTGTFSVSIGAISGSSGSVLTTSTVAGLRTLTTSVATGSSAFAGSIQNNNVGVLALTKLGAGVLTLSGSSSFSGGTTLNAGSLVAGHMNAFGSGTVVINSGTLNLASLAITNQITNNGGTIVNAASYGGTQSVAGVVSMTGTIGGTVNVAAAGELKGSGVVFNGPVTLASGAQHSPGNSPGTQTFNSGLSYSTGSILNWELITNSGTGAGTNYDFLSVTGGSLSVASGALLNLVFSGSGSTVSWSDPFWNANRSWTIIDALLATSSTGDFTLGTVSNDSLGRSLISVRPDAAFALDQSGNNVVLTFTAVPEPSTYVLALVGLGTAGWAMRRRKSHRARRAA